MIKKKTSFLFILLFLISFLSLYAQEIKGTVKDSKTNTSLAGVIVKIKGGTEYIVTDFDGNFLLNAKIGDTLVMSYVGYESKEIMISNKRLYNVLLHETEYDFGITFSEVIDDKMHNLYFDFSFQNNFSMGYRYSFSNRSSRKNKTNDELNKTKLGSFLYRNIDIGIEGLFNNKDIDAISPYIQFNRFSILDIGSRNIRLDIEPYINIGVAYFFNEKKAFSKFDIGTTLLKLKINGNTSLDFDVKYTIVENLNNVFNFSLVIGSKSTITRHYY